MAAREKHLHESANERRKLRKHQTKDDVPPTFEYLDSGTVFGTLLPERSIYQGTAKRARTTELGRRASKTYKVRFEDLKVGGVALVYCSEDDTSSPLAFRLRMGRSELSPWLFLLKIASINKEERQVTWLYFTANQFTCRSVKSVAIQKASKSKTWRIMTCTKHTAGWDEDEVVLSWECDAKDMGYSIPTAQYKQAQTAMLAVQQTTAVADED